MTSSYGLIIAIFFISTQALAGAFEYVDPMDSRSSLTIETAPPSISIGDVARPAELCADSTGFICLRSSMVNFAVPRTMNDKTKDWNYAGRTYALVSKSDVSILGFQQAGVLQVSSTDGDRKLTFLYSPTKGLLGMRFASKDSSRLYISTREIGFGVIDVSRQEKR